MVSIATDNVNDEEVKAPKNYDVREILLTAIMLGVVSTLFDFIMFSVFKGGGESVLQTYWFMGSILTELMLIFSIRTKLGMFRARSAPSRQILILTIGAIALTVLLPFTALGTEVFKFIRPEPTYLLVLFIIVVGYLLSTEFVKRLYFHFFEKTQRKAS